jgi:hypothetical protein
MSSDKDLSHLKLMELYEIDVTTDSKLLPKGINDEE